MSSIVIAGDTSGSVTLQAPAVSGSTVLNLPATSGTIQASGAGYTTNGVAYATSATGLTTGSALTFDGATTRLMVNASTNGGIGSFYVGNPSASSEYMNIVTSTSGTGALLFGNTTAATAGRYAGAITYSHTANTLAFDTDSTNRMVINSTGLGIGTSSPATKLAVAGGIAGTAGLNISGAGWGVLPYVANSLVIDNNGGETRLFATGANATTDGSFLFYTSQTDGGANERARIDTSGRFLVGTTSFDNLPGSGTSNGTGAALGDSQIKACRSAYTLQIGVTSTGAGIFLQQFFQAGNHVGTITVSNNNATAYQTSSDYRLKDNPQPMTGALEKVATLKPCTWTWKNTGDEGQGFIAHELQAVCPDAVSGTKDGVDKEGKPIYQGVDTSFLVATLTAAIQEQQALITQLTERITALEAK